VALGGADSTTLAIGVNGKAVGTIRPVATNALRYNTDRGVWREYAQPFDAALLKAGENDMTLTVPAGDVTTGSGLRLPAAGTGREIGSGPKRIVAQASGMKYLRRLAPSEASICTLAGFDQGLDKPTDGHAFEVGEFADQIAGVETSGPWWPSHPPARRAPGPPSSPPVAFLTGRGRMAGDRLHGLVDLAELVVEFIHARPMIVALADLSCSNCTSFFSWASLSIWRMASRAAWPGRCRAGRERRP